tara:strand:+ start:205 stop:432 length:228 start_codon:yes stop_codon:yes gene_type:complete
VVWLSAIWGGLWVLLLQVFTWYSFSFVDAMLSLNVVNEESAIDETELGLYRLITIQWAPIQFVTVFGVLLYVSLS